MNEIAISKSQKHSWLTNNDKDFKTTTQVDQVSKPKWFEEMVRNTNDEKKENSSDQINDLILDLDRKTSANEIRDSQQINTKRRNTLNILQTDNQNFLNTISQSAKPYSNLFLDQNLIANNIDEVSSKKIDHQTTKSRIKNNLNDETDKFLNNLTGELNEDFIIPSSPEGSLMRIVLKSNWDESNWIGLNGIEIFDLNTFKSVPSSKIKFLSNQDSSLYKLFDGIYRTHDDDHIWNCKFDTEKSIELKIEFETTVRIGLIRIWNYNKSRIYSYRGVREMVIYLDDIKIFDGEIRRANGELKGCLEFGDMIVYRVDEHNLQQIAENDTSFQELI